MHAVTLLLLVSFAWATPTLVDSGCVRSRSGLVRCDEHVSEQVRRNAALGRGCRDDPLTGKVMCSSTPFVIARGAPEPKACYEFTFGWQANMSDSSCTMGLQRQCGLQLCSTGVLSNRTCMLLPPGYIFEGAPWKAVQLDINWGLSFFRCAECTHSCGREFCSTPFYPSPFENCTYGCLDSCPQSGASPFKSSMWAHRRKLVHH